MDLQKNIMHELLKAIPAGICIGIGGWVYLAVDNRVAGAVLFSFGLLSVLVMELYLYTGMIGTASLKDTRRMFTVLVGNFIGAYATGLLASVFIAVDLSGKFARSPLLVFALSCMCGIIMYLSVAAFKKTKNPVYPVFGVAVFILAGFEHCIADAFYMGVQRNFYPLFCLMNILGNTVGSIVWYRASLLSEKCRKQ